MTSEQAIESAIESAKSVEEDLEKIAQSDLPFAHDAERILNELHEREEQ